MPDTRIATIASLAQAAAAVIKARARAARPLPLLADTMTWVELDRLVSWGPAEPTHHRTTIAEVP